MDPKNMRDMGSTIAGGGLGVSLLLTVRWETVPHGELVKIGVAFVAMTMGYFMYKGGDQK